jgi:hypothetical protein
MSESEEEIPGLVGATSHSHANATQLRGSGAVMTFERPSSGDGGTADDESTQPASLKELLDRKQLYSIALTLCRLLR